MKKEILSYGLSAIVLLSVFAMVMSATAVVQMAEELGVNDAMGNSGDYVEVPVNITSTMNGPIEVIGFHIRYDKTVLNLTEDRISAGVLTSTGCMEFHTIGIEEDNIRFVCINNGIPNESTDSVAVLNFSVIGAPGTTSDMNLTGISMKNEDEDVGFIPADGVKNGTFTVDAGVPSVTNPDANPGTIEADGVQESRLNVTVVDDIAVDVVVTVDLTQIGGLAEKIMEKIDGTLYSTTTNASIGTIPDTYDLPINATDLLGNYNNTEVFTLIVEAPANGSIVGQITYACDGSWIPEVIVNLTKEGSVEATTVTNETGYYNFTDVDPDSYFVNASKTGFWDNSTDVTVSAGEVKTKVNMMLWLKYDLNNNCDAADRGDLILMIDAYLTSTEDEKYDLNENGSCADRGDLILMIDAYLTS